jgi:hypothetical protein
VAVNGDVVFVQLESSLELIGKIDVIAAVRQEDCEPITFARPIRHLLVLRRKLDMSNRTDKWTPLRAWQDTGSSQ